jgi:thiol-disulfide isomerase/thioredoxin
LKNVTILYTTVKQLILLSIVCCLVVALSAFIGNKIKFVVGCLTYAVLTYKFIDSKLPLKHNLRVILIIALPVILLYLPIILLHFHDTRATLPSTLSHFIGIIFGYLIKATSVKAAQISLLSICVFIIGWYYFVGAKQWQYWLNFGTYDGNTINSVPVNFRCYDAAGQIYDQSSLYNKVTILDCWHTRCGACFTQFPNLEKYYQQQISNSQIAIYALNRPLKQDSVGQAFQMLKDAYQFPVLVPYDVLLPDKFGVEVYPTTIVINGKGIVVFRGRLEEAIIVANRELSNLRLMLHNKHNHLFQ